MGCSNVTGALIGNSLGRKLSSDGGAMKRRWELNYS